jgi:hypothetical protein
VCGLGVGGDGGVDGVGHFGGGSKTVTHSGSGGGGGSSAVDATGTDPLLLDDVNDGDGLVLISYET